MRLRRWNQAYPALTEALKQKRGSWKVQENLMAVCLALGRWRETAQHMNSLLDLRLQSQRPIHIDELRHLAYITSNMAQRAARTAAANASAVASASVNPIAADANSNSSMEDDEESEYAGILMVERPTPEPAQSVESLLTRITNTVPSDPQVWDVMAEFQHAMGRFDLELEARIKQFRAVKSKPLWERDKDDIAAANTAAVEMIKALKHLVVEYSM